MGEENESLLLINVRPAGNCKLRQPGIYLQINATITIKRKRLLFLADTYSYT